jgi:hypothetical protein
MRTGEPLTRSDGLVRTDQAEAFRTDEVALFPLANEAHTHTVSNTTPGTTLPDQRDIFRTTRTRAA